MNMQAMLKQAQALQKDMLKIKDEIDSTEFVGESSLVKVTLKGTKEAVKVEIKLDEDFDKEILGTSKNDDEIVNAHEEEEEEKMGQDKFVLVHGDYSDVNDVADDDDDDEDIEDED